jgi:hypothetical protein
MPSKPASQGKPGAAATVDSAAPDAVAIRVQLDRLLNSPHIRNSKRCQALLKYVVEASLDGCLDKVKERCIGFEIFGRDANYDTSHDSIVRTTAAEVRKRLAQYYLESEHQHEIRFILPPGSYCPEFRLPTPAPVVVAMVPVARRPWLSPRRALAACSALAAVTLAAVAYTAARPTAFARFWMPLLDDPSAVLICIEQPLRIYRFTGPRAAELNQQMVGAGTLPPAATEVLESSPVRLSELQPTGEQYFTYGDLISSARLSELLARKGKPFQVLGDRNTAYRDLRGRSAILLGQFNNQWTLGLTSTLRYYLSKNVENTRYEIRDRQAPDQVIASIPKGQRPEEFSIVSRIFDAATEKTVITVVGTTYFGTMAGSDFLTQPPYMQEAFRNAPANWYRKNIQVVLRAPIVRGAPGPPRVIATHFW